MGRFWIFFAYNGVPKSEILFPSKGMGNFIAEKSGNGDWTHNKKILLGYLGQLNGKSQITADFVVCV